MILNELYVHPIGTYKAHTSLWNISKMAKKCVRTLGESKHWWVKKKRFPVGAFACVFDISPKNVDANNVLLEEALVNRSLYVRIL